MTLVTGRPGVIPCRRSPIGPELLHWLALASLLLPWLLSYDLPPSSTFFNQAAAWGAWALLMLALASRLDRNAPSAGLAGSGPVLLALGLLASACVASIAWRGLPPSLGTGSLLTLAGAALATWAGATAAARGALVLAWRWMMLPIVVAALLSAVIAVFQVYVPGWEGSAVAELAPHSGRASGNLRQPNHLSSLAVWGIVGLLWFAESRRLGYRVAWPLLVLLVGVVMSTGSRTGVLGLLILALWGGIDRGLSRAGRGALLSLPIAYVLFWKLNAWWVHAQQLADGAVVGTSLVGMAGDLSSARFSIWSDTLALIRQQPWTGVGFGEFNMAWSLTPFPQRSLLFFDHTHNLPLHLAVELGLPLAAAVLGLLCLAFWRAFRAAGQAVDRADAQVLRAAFMLLLLIALHSMLEYPLWYAYFLLPTLFALGLCLGAPAAASTTQGATRATPAPPPRWLQAGALLMFATSLLAVFDYAKVTIIFAPGPDNSRSLAERIEAGKHSLFFAHHAHYAAATTAARPSQALDSFRVASHFLLDTRLMTAWARAQAEAGDLDRARHLADRLREFRNEASREFLEACEPPPPAASPLPFQCERASKPMDHRAFQ